jgi:hypothetical protein
MMGTVKAVYLVYVAIAVAFLTYAVGYALPPLTFNHCVSQASQRPTQKGVELAIRLCVEDEHYLLDR